MSGPHRTRVRLTLITRPVTSASLRRLCTAPSGGALWHHPFVRCSAGRSDAFEVCVVVQYHQAGHLSRCRRDEIWNRQPMLAPFGKRVLQIDRP